MKRPIVSSLSMSFRRAINVEEDVKEAKTEHRRQLKSLVEDFFDKLDKGEVEGIRNAKDLVEVMKMDLLLMGEVTDRTETVNELDEAKIFKVSQVIDEEDPNVQSIINDVLMALNGANDDADDSPIRRKVEQE